VIHNVENLDNSKINIIRKKTKKNQILLYDTKRRVDDFVNKIKYRKNSKYEDIPHFLVSKLGNVYQIFDTDHSSQTFKDEKIDKKIIKIAIENLGWLNKNTINGFLNNWIGDPYRGEPFIKNWRNHYFWDKYNEDQLLKISELCDFLCEKHNITKQIVPSQGFFNNVRNFKGVVCKSNFSDIYTDINPSFNFNIFFKNAEQTNIEL
jgi:hypothetical protein